MTMYSAIFVDREGRRGRGIFEARDTHDLQGKLRAQSLWPVRIRAMAPDPRLRRLTLRVRDLVQLLHQLELQLRAGVTADEALRQLAEDAPPGPTRTILSHVHREVSQGHPIHQACRHFPRLFPSHVAAVIEAGEVSAQLPEALRGLATHLTGVEELRRTARRAMIYPVIVLSATTGLVAFLLGGVVPRFAEIFASLHLALPAITVWLIRASEGVRTWWLVLLPAAVLTLAFLAGASRWPRLQALRDAATLHVPVLGDTVRHIATARFAAHCRLLHDAGIPLLDALATGAALTGHAVLSRDLLSARTAVATGRPLYAALPRGHAFPPFFIPALKAGETTGQLGAALRHIEEYATSRSRENLATAIALFEPILLGLLAGVVGAIALSFFLPLVSLLGGVNAH